MSEETRSAEEIPQTDLSSDGTTGRSRRVRSMLLLGGLFIVVLLVVGLFLPPISLAERLGLSGNTTSNNSTEVAGSAALEADVDGITVTSNTEVEVAAVTFDQLASGEGSDDAAAMADSVPANMAPIGRAYLLNYAGSAADGSVGLALPEQDIRSVDLYGWDGASWTFMPVQHTDSQVISEPGPLPQAVALFEADPAESLAVGADLQPGETLPAVVLPHLTELSVGRLVLKSDGSLSGEAVEATTGAYKQFLQVSNVGAIIDQAALTALLSDSTQVDAHVQAIVDAADSYAGVNLDYQAVPANDSAAFTAFVTQLADALHAENKLLLITVGTPAPKGAEWDTGGQDWSALGQVADAVNVQMPLNPVAYVDGGAAQKILTYALARVDRHKLNLQVTSHAIETIGGTFRTVYSQDALANFGTLNLTGGEAIVEAGDPVAVTLAGSASPLEWDGDTLMYRYTYEQNGQTYTVWINNEAAVGSRIAAARDYSVRGIMVTGLGKVANGAGYAAVLESTTGEGTALEVSGAAISWTVQDEEGAVIASSSGENLEFEWEGTDTPGTYTIVAEFAQGDAIAQLGTLEVVVEDGALAEAETEADEGEEPEATPEPTPEAEEDESEGAAAEPTRAPVDPGTADAAVGIAANLRKGPGVAYGVIDVLNVGTRVTITGRNAAADWVEVSLEDEREGWLFASLLNLNPALSLNSVAVVEAPPPVAGGGGDGGGNPLPPPPAPVAGGPFELGGQTVGSPRSAVMQSAGMTWVKRQHKWGPGNTGADVAGLVADGHANGFKVLLSIPGQLNPSSIDFNAYVNFLGEVAALPDPPDAIEIWNEMNISREWPSGQISPQSYVQNMLAPAYQRIKAANPGIMVITGAPAPTGFYGGGCSGAGCDDAPYIAGMMAAGAGSYSDCIGVHYNEGIMPPSATSGDPRGSSDHYTRYFQGMINAYVGAGAGQLCFTELGYLSGEEWGYVPQSFLWRAPYNLTVAEHAQYLASAVSIGANSGRVRMIIVFNVDFTTWGDDPQAGYAMIRPDGSCPSCILLGQVMGR